METIRCSAPGRCGLLGNPTDMYGGSVISCSIAYRAHVTVEPADRLEVTTCGQTLVIGSPSDLMLDGSLFDVARAVLDYFRGEPPVCRISYGSDIPIKAGVSGSTALTVAILFGLLRYKGLQRNLYQVAEEISRRLANIFLTHKTHQVQTGELQSRSFDHYYATCEGLLEHFGKTVFVDQIRPDDLLTFRHKLGETRNATSLTNEITRVRSVFRFAFENGLIDRPVRYGEFKRPSKSVIRRARTARGARLFEPAQLRKILKKANDQLRAMVLLGLNAGFGPGDITTLPLSAVDLETGWVSYARPKTGIERRCPLWNETIKALRVVRQKRKEPRDPSHSDRFFITQRREPWASNSSGATGIGHEFRKVLDTLKLYRTGLSFYVLRHCFQTIGDETGDYLAVRRIMGHADNSISDAYRERFPDERLKKVTDHVHDWLYGEGGA